MNGELVRCECGNDLFQSPAPVINTAVLIAWGLVFRDNELSMKNSRRSKMYTYLGTTQLTLATHGNLIRGT